MSSNGDVKRQIRRDISLDIDDDEVDGDSDLTLGESFEILDTEDDFEKKTITKIFTFCRNGEISKLESLVLRTNKKRLKRWLEKSHDDKVVLINFNIVCTNQTVDILNKNNV